MNTSKYLLLLKKSPLARAVFLLLFLIALIPALILSFFSYSAGAGIISKSSQEYSNNNLQEAYRGIRSAIDNIDTLLFSLTIDDRIVTIVRQGGLSVGSQNRSALRGNLSSALNQNRNLVEIISLETNLDTIFALRQSNIQQPDVLRISDQDLKSSISALHGNPYWIGIDPLVRSVLPGESGYQYIRVSSEVTGITIEEHLGYLSFFIRTSVFQNILNSIPCSTGQSIILLDPKQSIIASTSTISESLMAKLANSDLWNVSNFRVTAENIDYIISSVTDHTTGWHLISLLSEQAAVRNLRQTSFRLLLPLLLLPMICLLLTQIFFNRFYRMLSPLLTAIKKIGEGNIKERVPVGKDLIIDNIGTTMNTMLDQYEDQISVNAHQEALLITSRLKILRGQISPHFLYNTLDSINWKLIENGDSEASLAISRLGSVLRYSINEASAMVQLIEEINIITQYLQICKFRFEDRLNYQIQIEDSLENYEIPRFILQPIVENAIIYGLERTQNNASIRISCYSTECFTIIDISNDGPSITDEKKEQLYQSFQKNETDSEHIGLRNVYQRIRLFYGNPFSLSILDIQPQGTLMRLSLPPKDKG